MSYQAFIEGKRQRGADSGFDPLWMPDSLFDFQVSLTEWAIQKGRAAIFADCGLGKTAMQLAWGANVAEKTNKPVLCLTPLAVSAQTMEEAEKFGIEAHRSREGEALMPITVTNYERLHYFDPKDFGGVICDESSILKSFDGARRTAIIEFMRTVPYRLLATATAAPNDYIELGNSSEALGYLGHVDMLNRFFANDRANSATRRMYGEAPEWRFKGHGEQPFWRWVVSWARACRAPSDLGFDDDRFELPKLTYNEHIVEYREPLEGQLFALPAVTLAEQREVRKKTIRQRCELAASLVDHDQPAIVWCHLNAEGDLLESLIPDAVQVSGSDSDEVKEERLIAFAHGEAQTLVTKPRIGAWGLNFQHCADMVYFPSHSYEQFYQAVRRCWRFGQDKPVNVNLVMTEGERKVMDNLQRKAEQASAMFDALVAEMNHAQQIEAIRQPQHQTRIPAWLS